VGLAERTFFFRLQASSDAFVVVGFGVGKSRKTWTLV